jgi:crossover junction endodeoxyribonuclease RuvC
VKKQIGITVLGVDPGLNNFGYGLVREDSNTLYAIKYGQFLVPKNASFEDKLVFIGKTFASVVEETKPNFIAIEKIYVAKNTQIALTIGVVSGVMIYAGIERGVRPYFITPGEIKKTITGEGQAIKRQVCYMVQKILDIDTDPGEHAIDALAAAISFISINKFENMVRGL